MVSNVSPDKRGGFDRSMQHHLINLPFWKGGVGMRPGKRFGLSAIEKEEVWNRWKAGQSLHEIGRAFGKEHSCIRSVLLPRGGIRPAARRRSPLALTLAEREDISRGIASGSSIRGIAGRVD